MKEYISAVLLALMIVGAIIGSSYYLKEQKACEKSGGAYVKTFSGYTCVKVIK